MSEAQTSDKTTKAKRLLSDTFKTIIGVIAIAVVTATIFTAATPVSLLTGDVSNILADAISFSEATPTSEWPTATPRPRPIIGIVVGHSGNNNDRGAVCPDGLTELDVNSEVATFVKQNLKRGRVQF